MNDDFICDYRFDFPSVFIIYMTVVMMVICKYMNTISRLVYMYVSFLLAILVLISYGARDQLYCTHPELPLAYENPTFFCQFSGNFLHYIIKTG